MPIHYRTCHLCEAMCGLEITVENNQVKSIRGDKADVHSKGYLCPKATALQDIHEDPDRLKRPVKRTAQGWVEISWEEAFDIVEEKLKSIKNTYGNDAIGTYTGNPTVHNTGTILYLFDLLNAIDTKNSFASHSLDQLPQMFVAGEMFGHQAMFPIPDLSRTQHFLILGANPLVSNGSIMSTPNILGRLKGIQQRGGTITVVDPRRTRTAQLANRHVFIKPGTDVYLLLAFVHLLFKWQWVKESHVLNICDGLDELEKLVGPFTPQLASEITGIPEKHIEVMVEEFCKVDHAVCYGRLGVSTQEYGGLCHWLINIINILTGNMDVPGGVMFTKPAIDLLKALKKEAKQLRWKSRVKGYPETAGNIPTVTLADEVLTPGEGQIKAMLTIAGNPLLSAPNSQQMEKAFEQLDFYVAVDIYINETTRHADIILPPAAGLEVVHYDFALGIVAPRNFANFSSAIFPLEQGQKYDWQILFELQKRLETGNKLWLSLKHAVQGWLTVERRIDMGLKIGPYGSWGGRFLKSETVSLKKLKTKPHGIDFGKLEPCLPGRLFTKNKKISLVPQNIIKDVQLLSTEITDSQNVSDHAKTPEMLLIGRRHLRSNNSWMHNYQRLMKDGDKRCSAQIHPDDAKRLGIDDGQRIKVSSRTGEVLIRVEISDEVMPGVLSIPHGWGHSRKETRLDISKQFPGVNVNELTDNVLIDTLSGNAVFNGVPVTVEVPTTLASPEKEQKGIAAD